MQKPSNVIRENSPLAILVAVIALGFFLVAFITPLFGWDPFRTLFDYAYSRNPAVTTLIVLTALGFSFWIDWRAFREKGDKTLVFRLTAYGIITATVLIFWSGFLIANRI